MKTQLTKEQMDIMKKIVPQTVLYFDSTPSEMYSAYQTNELIKKYLESDNFITITEELSKL